jgi:hypothetical protein
MNGQILRLHEVKLRLLTNAYSIAVAGAHLLTLPNN